MKGEEGPPWAEVDLEENTSNSTHTDCWNLHLETENQIIQPVSIIGLNNGIRS